MVPPTKKKKAWVREVATGAPPAASPSPLSPPSSPLHPLKISPLEALPLEILWEIHKYLHAPVLLLVSKTLHSALRPSKASTGYKALYLLSSWYRTCYAAGLNLRGRVCAIQEIENAAYNDQHEGNDNSAIRLIFPKLDREQFMAQERSTYFLDKRTLRSKVQIGPNKKVQLREKASDYCHPLYLSLPRSGEETNWNPIDYALRFFRGNASVPEECLCSTAVIERIEQWLYTCPSLRATAFNLCSVVSHPSLPDEVGFRQTDDEASELLLERMRNPEKKLKADEGKKRGGEEAAEDEDDNEAKEFSTDPEFFTMLYPLLKTWPLALMRRVVREAHDATSCPSAHGLSESCGDERRLSSSSSTSKESAEDLYNLLRCFGEGPMPRNDNTLKLLLLVIFRYGGSFTQHLEWVQPTKEAQEEICAILISSRMQWLLRLFLQAVFVCTNWFHDGLEFPLCLRAIEQEWETGFFTIWRHAQEMANGRAFGAPSQEQLHALVALARRFALPQHIEEASCPTWTVVAQSNSARPASPVPMRSAWTAFIQRSPDFKFLPATPKSKDPNFWPRSEVRNRCVTFQAVGRSEISSDEIGYVGIGDAMSLLPPILEASYRGDGWPGRQCKIDRQVACMRGRELEELLAASVKQRANSIARFLLEVGVPPTLETLNMLEDM